MNAEGINPNLTEEEYARLIHMATRDRVVCCKFGPRGVWLEKRAENDWAFEALAAMRVEQSKTVAKPC